MKRRAARFYRQAYLSAYVQFVIFIVAAHLHLLAVLCDHTCNCGAAFKF